MNQDKSAKEKLFMSGNEAIARGAFEAGVKVASAYPGTPSTEILQNLVKYEGVYTEWAPNEKVAAEVAIGASFAGARALATMKHVGLNVAADPIFTAAYTGVRGGLVIVTADDPSMHSSQNEQDNRNYAYAAKLPMLEPADPGEAKEFARLGFQLSEEMDIPVLLRATTRISHVKGLVSVADPETPPIEPGIERVPQKMVMLPAFARSRRVDLEARMKKLRAYAETFGGNRIEWADKKMGIITAGVSYLYAKEAFPEASVLKLGMVFPFPEKMIRDFAAQVDKLYIVEELDSFIELHVKAMGIDCIGKEVIPAIGELNSHIVRRSIVGETADPAGFAPIDIPMRPPNMCPGCPHRGLFRTLKKLKVFVTGDIGCYTLGALPPLSAMDACVCMGASIGMAQGMDKALGEGAQGKVAAVIGDSTFLHSGVTGLMNIVYNKGISTVIILDNRITAMTGHQDNPASGRTLMGEATHQIDLEALCRSLGVEHVYSVMPHDLAATEALVKREIERPEPSVIITRFPCVLLPEERSREKDRYKVTTEKCNGCQMCLRVGCPAIKFNKVDKEEAARLGLEEKQKGYAQIDPLLCVGCSECFQLCKFDAISKDEYYE